MDAGLVGRLLLYGGMATCVWGAVASLGGRLRRDRGLAASGRRGRYATTGLLLVAAAWLAVALLRHDFSLAYVAQVTSRSTRSPYSFADRWAGIAGEGLIVCAAVPLA